MQTWWTRKTLPAFGSRTTWRPFHADDARIRAGPLWNLFLVGHSTRELFQTATPRFLQHTLAGRQPPLIVRERAERWTLRTRWLYGKQEGRKSPPLSLTGQPSAPPVQQWSSLPVRKRTTCCPRQSGTNSLISRAPGRTIFVALAPPTPSSFALSHPPKPVALLRSSHSGCLRRRRLEEPLWGAVQYASDFFLTIGHCEPRNRRCCRWTGYLK